MKTLLTVLAFISIATANAQETKAPEYYSANFEIEKITPMCPAPSEGKMVCMAMGAVVTLKATIGCADTFLLADITEVGDLRLVRHTQIHVASVVKAHPQRDVIRCAKAQVIRKTITSSMGKVSNSVINSTIETLYTTF